MRAQRGPSGEGQVNVSDGQTAREKRSEREDSDRHTRETTEKREMMASTGQQELPPVWHLGKVVIGTGSGGAAGKSEREREKRKGGKRHGEGGKNRNEEREKDGSQKETGRQKEGN